ncbi:hypothetical protein D9615_004846 [Tricholomella constricta]|uniref:DUF1275 domain protein n=1 Tax=Tricholomella constricta TaxID=117010 RepID=A0A8H5M6G0_9AGAR|nr:hypothetical protein D9615_004846 [Tricholomella constricta]
MTYSSDLTADIPSGSKNKSQVLTQVYTASSSTSMNNSKADVEEGMSRASSPPPSSSFWTHLNSDVDPAQCTGPLAAFCFMTGYIDVISFSAIFVWCGFQTGNWVQLSLAIARLFEGPKGFRDTTFHRPDQQALCSLIAFNLGAFVGRIGDRVGPMKRIWLISGTLLQAFLTMAAALTVWKSGQPSIAPDRGAPAWTNNLTFVSLAFMSASLGVQGIQGKRLNTQFGTTIVLTTVWVELVSDPRLFKLREKVVSRDHKIIAALALFVGGFMGRALVGKIGAAGTLGIAVGLRVLIAVSWIFVGGKSSAT